MIKLDIDERQLETKEGLIKIVNKILWLQIGLSTFSERSFIQRQEDNYYGKGNEYNLHKPMVDLSTKTFIGDLPDIVTKKPNDAEKKKISKFSQLLYKNNFHENIFKVGQNCSISGRGFLLLYHDNGDTFTKFRFLDPKYTNVVYDCSVAERPLFGFNILPIYDFSNGKQIVAKYIIYVYTKDYVYSLMAKAPNTITANPNCFRANVYNCFLIAQYDNTLGQNTETLDFKVPHDYKDIPLIEFANNYERVGDTLCVEDLIREYDKLQHQRTGNVEDIMRYLLVLKNVRLGDEKEQRDFVDMVKNERVLPIEGENVDAKLLSNPLDQTDLETLVKSIKNDIHYISHIPDLTSVDFSQNASDPIIKIKTKPLLDLCLEKEIWFSKSYTKVIDLALDFARNFDNDYEEIDFDENEIVLKYSHTLPSNDVDATNMACNLINAGIGSPRELLQNIKAIGNVDDYMANMKKWIDFVDERKAKLNEKSENNGVNDTNIKRQNSILKSANQNDNIKNATIGNAKDISENKVV